MGSHIYRGSDCVNNAFCSNEDKDNLAGRAAALEAIDDSHLQYVCNDLKRHLKISDAKRCEEKNNEILKRYLEELNIRMTLKKKPLSAEDLQALKIAFLARCKDMFCFILVAAALQMRKPVQNGLIGEGRFSSAFMHRYVKIVAKDLYGMEIR